MFAAYLPARRASRRSLRSRRCATTSRCPSRRCASGCIGRRRPHRARRRARSCSASSATVGSGAARWSDSACWRILVGVSLMSPVLGRPVIRGLGVRLSQGSSARSACSRRENSLRNPRRTAATASALMIGLTLVAMMSILGASMKASFDKVIDGCRQLPAGRQQRDPDAVLAGHRQGDPADRRGRDRGAVPAGRRRRSTARTSFLGAADPNQLAKALNVDIDVRAVEQFPSDGDPRRREVAENKDLQVGDDGHARVPERQADQDTRWRGCSWPTRCRRPTSSRSTPSSKGGLKPADSLLFITTEPGAERRPGARRHRQDPRRPARR